MELKTVKKTLKEIATILLKLPSDTMIVFSSEPFGEPNKYWDAVFISKNGSEYALYYHGNIGLFKTLEEPINADVIYKQMLDWLNLSEDTDMYVQVKPDVEEFLVES